MSSRSHYLLAVLRSLGEEAEACPLRASVPDVQRFTEAVYAGDVKTKVIGEDFVKYDRSEQGRATNAALEEGTDAPSWPLRADVDRFTTAAWRGDVQAMRRQVLAGHDLNARDRLGFTALMRAAIGGNAGAVRFLLEEGADAAVLSHRLKVSALSLAELLRTDRKEELQGQARFWKEESG